MTKMRIDKKYGFLVINGKYYEAVAGLGKPSVKELNIKEIEDKISKAKKIAEKLKTKVDVKAIITESVMKIPFKDIDKLYKTLCLDKKEHTIKTRKHYCVDVKIGNFILPIDCGT